MDREWCTHILHCKECQEISAAVALDAMSDVLDEVLAEDDSLEEEDLEEDTDTQMPESQQSETQSLNGSTEATLPFSE